MVQSDHLPARGGEDPAVAARAAAEPPAGLGGAELAVETEPPRAGAGRWGLAALLAALAVWGGWFIFRTSFVVDGRRVFCLFDDAMISMTYARNLVEGYGLNWARQGAPVEGFTHPLWTALMVPVNLLPIGLDRRCLVVQLGCLALLLLHVALVRRLVLRHFTLPGARHWAPACVLTAFYYPLNFWSLIGMETGLQALLTTASVLLALDITHCRRNRHLALLLVGTLAVLLRMDMALLVVAVQAYLLACGALPRGESEERRAWLLGAAVLAASVAGYTLFRLAYFHDLLPNTYYLKLGGIPLAVRLLRGGSSLLDTLGAHWPLLLVVGIGVAPLLLPLAGRGRQRPDGLATPAAPTGPSSPADPAGPAGPADPADDWGRRLALPALVFVLCCAYSVYVGGDAWEGEVSANRFVAFAMPQVFVLFNALANRALAAAKRRWRLRLRRTPPAGSPQATLDAGPPPVATGRRPAPPLAGDPLPLRYGLLAATVAALLAANGLWQPEAAEESWKTFTLVTRPTHADKYAALVGLVRKLRAIAEPSAAVAVVWAGTPAYFSDFRMVDTLGYNDRHIARGKPARELTEDTFDDFVPGHVKWDYSYLLDERRPDAFLQIWGGREVVLLLRARGYRRLGDLWIDPASPRIHLPPLASAPRAGAAQPAAEPDGEAGPGSS
jgi:hypothetical protein